MAIRPSRHLDELFEDRPACAERAPQTSRRRYREALQQLVTAARRLSVFQWRPLKSRLELPLRVPRRNSKGMGRAKCLLLRALRPDLTELKNFPGCDEVRTAPLPFDIDSRTGGSDETPPARVRFRCNGFPPSPMSGNTAHC